MMSVWRDRSNSWNMVVAFVACFGGCLSFAVAEGNAGSRFIEEKRSSIWANPLVMVFVLTFLIVEWYFRRRWGLV